MERLLRLAVALVEAEGPLMAAEEPLMGAEEPLMEAQAGLEGAQEAPGAAAGAGARSHMPAAVVVAAVSGDSVAEEPKMSCCGRGNADCQGVR